MSVRVLATATFLASILAVPRAVAGERMIEAGQDAPPSGFVSFCMREPAQCQQDGSSRKRLHLGAGALQILQMVNDDVNWNTRWIDDLSHYGRREYFAIVTDGKGDCDDIAVTKRARLHEQGIPLHDLRLTIAATPSGERHAVLTVTTDEGDYVLDSLDPVIRRWDEVRYTWIERQDGSAMGWSRLEMPEPLVASNADDASAISSPTK